MSQAPICDHHPIDVAAPDLACWGSSDNGVRYVHERDSHQPGPEVLLTALVHGNEYSGALALDAFLRSGLMPKRGRITAAFCNVAAFHRFDLQQPDASRFIDEDFNRVWAAERLEGAGHSVELDRARMILPFVQRATHLLDLHSMHEPAAPLMITGLLPRNIAFAQRMRSGYQVMADAGHQDGVRLRDFGSFADPAGDRISLGMETGQHWERSAPVVARNVLMRFLLACDVLDAAAVPPGWLQPDALSPPPVTVTHRVVARSSRFAFVQDFRGGEKIEYAGTRIATDADEAVTTPYDDCVLIMPSVRHVRPGVTVVRLGRLDSMDRGRGL